MGKYTVTENKSKSVIAANGLSLNVDPVNGRVTVMLGREQIAGNASIVALIQAAKMLEKVSPEHKFVCDTHGSYVRRPGRSQAESCTSCLETNLEHVRQGLSSRGMESAEDA